MSAPPAIVAEHLSVRLGIHTALDDVTLSLPDGAFAAILGPNGAGKSTLLRVLLGLVQPAAGVILIGGRPWSLALARDIGYVPQAKIFDRRFPALAMELVATGLRGAWPVRLRPDERDRCLAVLGQVGAEHLAQRAVGQLSGGELQRVYLARSLARRPRLLLLDEPATGVDRSHEGDLLELLERYRAQEGCTIVMVTHDWSVAQFHASHVVVLNKQLVACGPADEAMTEATLGRAFGHAGHTHVHRHGEHEHGPGCLAEHNPPAAPSSDGGASS